MARRILTDLAYVLVLTGIAIAAVAWMVLDRRKE